MELADRKAEWCISRTISPPLETVVSSAFAKVGKNSRSDEEDTSKETETSDWLLRIWEFDGEKSRVVQNLRLWRICTSTLCGYWNRKKQAVASPFFVFEWRMQSLPASPTFVLPCGAVGLGHIDCCDHLHSWTPDHPMLELHFWDISRQGGMKVIEMTVLLKLHTSNGEI